MARTETFGQMLTDLKAGAGLSTSSAVGQQANDELKYLLNQVQLTLYTEHDWPFLWTYRDVTINAGQRLYDIPDDLVEESVRSAEVLYGGEWLPVGYGITRDQLNEYDGTGAANERASPVMRWRVFRADGQNVEQIEVWPLPDSEAQTLRVYGKVKCTKMVADADPSILDGQLIVAFAVAAKRAGQKDGEAKQRAAERLLWGMRQGASKGDAFRMGEKSRPRQREGSVVRVNGGA